MGSEAIEAIPISSAWLRLHLKTRSCTVMCKFFHLTLNKKERVHFRSPKP